MPITTFGYIVEARRRCRGVGTGLFTVMSRENLPGGGLGKIVSPQNLAVVTTAVQAPGKDAEILKKAAPFSLGLLVLLGALVFIAAQGWLGGYFPPGEPPGPSPLRPLRSTPFAEIGRTPARDRSASAPRSVAFRLEIGPLPRRDRSHSGSRSVLLIETRMSPTFDVIAGSRQHKHVAEFTVYPGQSWPQASGFHQRSQGGTDHVQPARPGYALSELA